MHEYAIAYDVYATAKRAAEENAATEVKRVHVEIGDLAMANPEQVEFLFVAITEDDPLFRGAALECHRVPVRSRCGCGYEGDERFVCPRCGSLPELVAGREIRVSSVEIEVPES